MFRYLHTARICLELRTPMSIGSGIGDPRYDIMLVRDANGLPFIPGTAIAGLLRSCHASSNAPQSTAELFGRPSNDETMELNYEASRLNVSAAHAHDSKDNVVDGLLLGDAATRFTDSILSLLRQEQPHKRDRVRLSRRGTASDTGKFDRAVVPAGCRFSFDISIKSSSPQADELDNVIGLLSDARFRIGGATRGGLGAIKIVRLAKIHFDLQDLADIHKLAAWTRRLDVAPLSQGHSIASQENQALGTRRIGLKLIAEDSWRFSSSDEGKDNEGNKINDTLKTESRIVWSENTGTIGKQELLIPASSIKGALRHRTLFHLLRRKEIFADDKKQHALDEIEQQPELETLFGTIKSASDSGKTDNGLTGRLLIDDIYQPLPTTSLLKHNSIDRFTGGTRSGALFTEEVVKDGRIDLNMILIDEQSISPIALAAFADALKDLSSGRLALGAGDAKGHGRFHADLKPVAAMLETWMSGALQGAKS